MSYDEKVKSIKDTINETMNNSEDLNHLYINFTSLSSGGTAWNSPYYYASYINPEIAAYIKQENPKELVGLSKIILVISGHRFSIKKL